MLPQSLRSKPFVTCNGIVIYLLLCRDIISAFEEYDSLRGNISPVLPSTALVLAREQRGRPDIGIVAGTDSKRYCTYIQLVRSGIDSILPNEGIHLCVYIDFG
jgi:hypothetical protein